MLRPIINTQRLFLSSTDREIAAGVYDAVPDLHRGLSSARVFSSGNGSPVANIYSVPSLDADVGSQSVLGQPLGVLEKNGDWLQVRTPDQ
jgi:hypothetical protein